MLTVTVVRFLISNAAVHSSILNAVPSLLSMTNISHDVPVGSVKFELLFPSCFLCVFTIYEIIDGVFTVQNIIGHCGPSYLVSHWVILQMNWVHS